MLQQQVGARQDGGRLHWELPPPGCMRDLAGAVRQALLARHVQTRSTLQSWLAVRFQPSWSCSAAVVAEPAVWTRASARGDTVDALSRQESGRSADGLGKELANAWELS